LRRRRRCCCIGNAVRVVTAGVVAVKTAETGNRSTRLCHKENRKSIVVAHALSGGRTCKQTPATLFICCHRGGCTHNTDALSWTGNSVTDSEAGAVLR